MDNETLTVCKNESLAGGAIPNDGGALYYGMVAVSSQAISQNRRLNHKQSLNVHKPSADVVCDLGLFLRD